MKHRGSWTWVVGWASLALVALAASAWIAFDHKAVDRLVILWVYGLHTPALDVVMWVVSALGAAPTLAVVVVALAVSHAQRGEGRRACWVVALPVAAQVLNSTLKLAFQLPRPALLEGVVLPATYAYPSGHAMVSTVTYGVAAWSLGRWRPGLRAVFWWGAAAWVAAIGFSRIYLGVHWPSDVLGGVAIGALLLLLGRVLGPSDYPLGR